MNSSERRTPPILPALLVALILTACSSTRPFPCSNPVELRPPRNFGVVRAADGAATSIYRGGQPAKCGELEYLQSIGVRSILKLNDRDRAIDEFEEARARELGLQIRSFAFNAATIGRGSTCGAVREALSFLEDPGNWPLFVHCTAGKDRTGYMIGLYEKRTLRKPTKAVLDELQRFGHRGIRSLVMGQIDAELAKADPRCTRGFPPAAAPPAVD